MILIFSGTILVMISILSLLFMGMITFNSNHVFSISSIVSLDLNFILHFPGAILLLWAALRMRSLAPWFGINLGTAVLLFISKNTFDALVWASKISFNNPPEQIVNVVTSLYSVVITLTFLLMGMGGVVLMMRAAVKNNHLQRRRTGHYPVDALPAGLNVTRPNTVE